MKKADVQEIDTLFRSIIDKFDGICGVCHKPYPEGKSWVLHHRFYIKGEKTYDDFRFADGKKDKLNYYRYLIPLIQAMSKKEAKRRFRLLHNTHHYQAEMHWAIYRPENFERMVDLAREINRRKFSK